MLLTLISITKAGHAPFNLPRGVPFFLPRAVRASDQLVLRAETTGLRGRDVCIFCLNLDIQLWACSLLVVGGRRVACAGYRCS